MSYFKINNNDYSNIVSALKVESVASYSAQTNAAGNTVVDYINTKRTIEVGIIPLDSVDMLPLQRDINAFSVTISFLNPNTNLIEENVACIIPSSGIEYYTIQTDKVRYKALTLKFTEL